MNKQDKGLLYKDYQKYIGWIVKMFLLRYPRYKYLQDDLVQECAMRFIMIIDQYDPGKAEITTFLHSQLAFYMSNFIKKEIRYKEMDDKLGEVWAPQEVSKDNEMVFEELIAAEGVTDLEKRRLRLYFVVGYSQQEIADIEEVTAKAVSLSIASALPKIERSL